MALLFNGSPVRLTGLAEGRTYHIPPGETVREDSEFRCQVLLNQLAAAGLRELKHGDDKEAIGEECRAAFMEHTEKCIQEFNDVRSSQKQQGLRLPAPSADLKTQVAIYQQHGGKMTLAGVPKATRAATAAEEEEVEANEADADDEADDQEDDDAAISNVNRTRRSVTKVPSGKKR